MKTNYILAVLLSFGVLYGWTQWSARHQPIPPAPIAGSPSSAAPTAASPDSAAPVASAAAPAAAPARERLVEYTVGQNRVAFNLFGASVHQWSMLERERWISMVPLSHKGRFVATFPDLEYTVTQPSPQTFVFTARRPDGLSVKKTYALAPKGFLHNLTVELTNSGTAPLSVDYALGWGPGLEALRRRSERLLAQARAG